MGLLDGLFNRNKAGKPGKPDFSGVQSGGSSTASAPPASGPIVAPRGGGGGTYTVVKGDSLSRIAKQHYGDASKWRTIYEANRDLIKDPDLIYPGQSLKIPEA